MGMMDLMLEQIGRTYGKQLEEFAKNYAGLCNSVAKVQRRQIEFADAMANDKPLSELADRWKQEDIDDARRNSGISTGSGG